MGLILLDIDRFKSYNDRYGHPTGDRILVETVHRLEGNLRTDNLLGRWGGEEFLVVAPLSDLSATYSLAERLRFTLSSAPLPSGHSVSVSCGVASYRRGESLLSLLERVDGALLEAKGKGRNRVVAG